MEDIVWNAMDFGLHNHEILISSAKARPLSPQEDGEFVAFVRKLHSKGASSIGWGGEALRHPLVQELKGKAQDCDLHLARATGYLNLDPNELAWVGWHDQWEMVEIEVGTLLDYSIPALFVGYGMVVLGVNRDWLIEYKFDDVLYAARIVK